MQQAVSAAGGGRAVVERHYSRQAMIQQYEDLFERLTTNRGAWRDSPPGF
jgi:hypothetical protein